MAPRPMCCSRIMLARASTYLAAFVFFTSISAFAQTSTGTIAGTVADPQGNVISGATVTSRQVATNLTRTVTTSDQGYYRFDSLPVGVYELSVEAAAFQKKVFTQVQVLVGQTTEINTSLSVGQLQQVVKVQGGAPLVNTTTATIGEVVDTRRLVDIPLNGRNFMQLGLLTAGSAPPAEGGLTETYGTAAGGVGFSIGGARDSWNDFTLDGIVIVDPEIRTVTMQPSVDTVQEFQIIHDTYTADVGGPPGASVNLTTKSGINNWNGTLYEFFRNDIFDARNFFDLKKPPYRQNQFGGALGGPVKKDKTFFFVNYEGIRIRQGLSNLTLLPTNAIRNGDLSGVNPGTGQPFPPIIDPQTGKQFQGNKIPPNRINPIANALLALTPLPNLPNAPPGQNNNVNVDTRKAEGDQGTIRVDHQINEKNRLFGRFTAFRNDEFVPFTRNTIAFNPQAPPGFGSNYDDSSQNAGLGLTTVFTPTLVSDLRIGFNRLNSTRNQANSNLGFLDTLRILRAGPTLNRGVPNMSIPGFASLGDPDILPISRLDKTFYLSEGVSWTRGKNTFQFGGVYQLIHYRLGTNIFSQGVFTFLEGPGSATGSAWSDFLLDRPFLGLVGLGIDQSRQGSMYAGMYFADAYRMTRKLTISMGLRYDISQPPRALDGRAQMFNPATGDFLVMTNNGQLPADVNTSLMKFYQTSFGTKFATPSQEGFPNSLTEIDWKNLAPRLGIVYDVFGTGKTVLRAGYGIYTAPRELYTTGGQIAAAPPFYSTATELDLARLGVPVPPATFEQAFMGGNLAPGGDSPTPHSFDGYVQRFTADIQQQIGSNLVLQLLYAGSIAVHINHFSQGANQGLPNLPGQRRGFRPHSGAGLMLTESDDIVGTYHSGTVRVAKRLGGGLSFSSFYTFSKTIDTGSTLAETSGSPTFAADSYNQRAEKALSSFDVRHRFVTNFIWDLPVGTEKRHFSNGIWGQILANWQTAGILTFQSGQPFTPQLASSLDGTLSAASRPDRICDGNLSSSQRSPDRWFVTNCFVNPPLFFDAFGPYSIPGNSGRNVLIGPGVMNFDFSLQKRIPFKERQRIDFRWEVFNLANHANFHLPGRLVGTPNFGEVTSARDARLMQFSLRYSF
jgi:hypothetical protein